MSKVFANGPRDQGSIQGRVIPKTQKMVPFQPCLTLKIISYLSRVMGSNPGEGVAPSTTPQCSICLKGSLPVPLD